MSETGAAVLPRLRLRLRLAVLAGRLAGLASRLLRRGEGVLVQGRVTLLLDPSALSFLAIGRRIVLVTGTNGKTTTTAMIVAALGREVATNPEGANVRTCLVAPLARTDAPIAVLEVDELHLPAAIRELRPEIVVALNLTRDQLHRMHEVGRVSGIWAAAFTDALPTVVASAADPNVVAAARHGSPVWVDPGVLWTHDATTCPDCHEPMSWTVRRWGCACGLTMPESGFRVEGSTVHLPDGGEVVVVTPLPGAVNIGNAAFAIATAGLLGVPPDLAAERISRVTYIAGRYSRVALGGRPGQLLLAKNPAGWAAALAMVDPDAHLIVSINARYPDGLDTSWLYDVDFEHLAGRPVGATGERRDDLALRLHYAGALPIVDADPVRLARDLPSGELVVVANYSAFLDLRRHEV